MKRALVHAIVPQESAGPARRGATRVENGQLQEELLGAANGIPGARMPRCSAKATTTADAARFIPDERTVRVFTTSAFSRSVSLKPRGFRRMSKPGAGTVTGMMRGQRRSGRRPEHVTDVDLTHLGAEEGKGRELGYGRSMRGVSARCSYGRLHSAGSRGATIVGGARRLDSSAAEHSTIGVRSLWRRGSSTSGGSLDITTSCS